MQKFYKIIKNNPLFEGIVETDLPDLLQCLDSTVKSYQKGDLIFIAGAPINTVGLVLDGCVQVLREDADGKQALLAELRGGSLFGEAFVCAKISESPVTVAATAPSQILLIHYGKLITKCPTSCKYHSQLIENMLRLMAQKNLYLNSKIEILSKRTTRQRLLVYFDQQRRGARKFSIPFNREELASYLCVDRSAMSAELSKMQKDGLIRIHRNEVELSV